MNESPKLPDSFEEAERFQRLFVQPLVEAVKIEMKTHVEDVTTIVQGVTVKVKGHEDRLNALETNQKKALIGWGVITLAVGTAVTAAWNYIRTKVHIG